MTISLDETLLNFNDAPKVLPSRNGKRIHPSTIYRWTTRGVRGVKLETLTVGGVTYTSREALDRFARQLSAKSAKSGSPPKPQAPSSRAAAAKRHLEAAGIR